MKADVLRPSHGQNVYSSGGHRPDKDTFHVTIIHSGFIVDLPIENDDFPWDLPSGYLLHSHGKIHHAINR